MDGDLDKAATHFVFGYGSLIWNPGFPHLSAQQGLLRGAHRSLSIVSHHHRGTPQQPGLVFGLTRGGSCRGMVFEVADADRALYHAAAIIGGNALVTLHHAATRILRDVGAPPEAIVPLMARTIQNGFEPTGPIVRGDWRTVQAHLAALDERAPDLVPLYRALVDAAPR